MVIDWIENGVELKFDSEPHPFVLNNREVTLQEQRFLDNEILSLLKRGYIVESCDSQKPLCISPVYCVPKKNGKFRLINNLRKLNSFCKLIAFQYEDVNCVMEIVKSGDKLVTVDIKDGFYHMPVAECSQKYLGFKWRNTTYMWAVLPFGLSVSPYIICKTIRQAIKILRGAGFRLSVYVDDFILCADEHSIDFVRETFLTLLCDLGLHVNWDKSNLVPSTEQQHLGHIMATNNKDGYVWIRVPSDRIRKVKHDINRAIKSKALTARALARICGQLISMSKAVLPAKLLLRNLYWVLRAGTS